MQCASTFNCNSLMLQKINATQYYYVMKLPLLSREAQSCSPETILIALILAMGEIPSRRKIMIL
jgi:hypothetical protein